MKTNAQAIESIKSGKSDFLTIENAMSMKGNTVEIFSFGYVNQDTHCEITIGDIVSRWDNGKNVTLSDGSNQQEYWRRYMTKEQIEAMKKTKVLLDKNGDFKFPYLMSFDGVFTCGDADRYVYIIK